MTPPLRAAQREWAALGHARSFILVDAHAVKVITMDGKPVSLPIDGFDSDGACAWRPGAC